MDKLSWQDKLSYNEYQILKTGASLGYPSMQMTDLFTKFNTHFSHEKKDFLRVCIFKNDMDPASPMHNTWNFKESTLYTLKKIVCFVGRIFFPQGHVNFLSYDSKSDKFHTKGLSQEGLYDVTVSGNYHPNAEEYHLNIKKMIPTTLSTEKHDDFEKKFTANINKILSLNYTFTYRNGVYDFILKGLFPISLFRTTPSDIACYEAAKQKKGMLCSRVVCETIIAAQVMTCEEMGVEAPSSLSFFGLYDRQNMNGMTPSRLRSAFLNAGIFTPIWTPFQ